ncbi:MAG: hypothetical protein IPJ65_16575 [Archangiaceae bacterium]|nr:hypothetical protein [Archangiaceae bacterium]
MLRSGALFTVAVLLPAAASATAFQIEARTEAQVESFRAWRGTDADSPVLLPRRRLVQYLGLNGYEIIPKSPLGFESSLRVFADFGLPRGEANRIDGARSEDADLLFANLYYRGKNLQFRLGRQLYTDVLDMMAFDGAWVRYVFHFGAGFGVGAEAYAGLWVKAGSLLGSSVYQPDGIRESDLRRVAALEAQPYAALDDIEPVVGAKVSLENLAGVSANAGFRQSWLGGKTDLRRIGADLKWQGFFGITVMAGLDYDLLGMRVANARWLGRYDANELALQVEYLRVSPVLSADSIWAYFATAPRDGVRARFDYFPVGVLRIYVQGVADMYGTPLNPNSIIGNGYAEGAITPPGGLSYGGGGGVAVRAGSFRVNADVTFKTGYGGRQLWGDLNGGYVPLSGTFTAEARVSVANITDQVASGLRGTYTGVQVYASYLLTRASRMSLVAEANFGPATRSDVKVFALYDLKAVF